MSFHETTPPSPAEIIDPPCVPGEYLVTIPSLDFFKTGLAFWHTCQDADQAGDALGRMAVERIRDTLCRMAVGCLTVGHMAHDTVTKDREFAGSWYVASTSVMAFSCMWLEVTKGCGSGICLTNADFCLDFDPADPYKSGLHSRETQLREVLGIEWPEAPDSPIWYKGESVYLQVCRSAQPTKKLTEDYRRFYGTFIPERFASVVPRLKREAWEA